MNEALEHTLAWPPDLILVNYVRWDFLLLSSVHELYVGNRAVSVGTAIVVSKNGPLEASFEPSRKISTSLKPWENNSGPGESDWSGNCNFLRLNFTYCCQKQWSSIDYTQSLSVILFNLSLTSSNGIALTYNSVFLPFCLRPSLWPSTDPFKKLSTQPFDTYLKVLSCQYKRALICLLT